MCMFVQQQYVCVVLSTVNDSGVGGDIGRKRPQGKKRYLQVDTKGQRTYLLLLHLHPKNEEKTVRKIFIGIMIHEKIMSRHVYTVHTRRNCSRQRECRRRTLSQQIKKKGKGIQGKFVLLYICRMIPWPGTC